MSNRKLSHLKLHAEVLKKNGRNEFVVLPYKEFMAMREQLEDAMDLVALRRAVAEDNGGPGISLQEMKSRLGMNDKRGRSKRRRISRN